MDRRTAIKNAILGGGALSTGWLPDIQLSFAAGGRAIKDEAYWEEIKAQFRFKEGLLYFNNASLGSSPVPVSEATEKFRKQLDSYPSKYMWGDWTDEKDEVRDKVANLLGANPDEIALTHNTTEGMNVIASSMDLKKGDEVIICNHEHPTARIPWVYYQEERREVNLVRPELPLDPVSKEDLVNVFRNAITKKTRVISVVHITNTNGMILPIKEICAMAREHGILTAVDGAQSMAAIDIDLKNLGCDYFASSAHKWLFSPKGMGVLYASEDAPALHPLIANRGFKRKNMKRIEDYNTRNYPELLGMGVALDFLTEIGLQDVITRTRELKQHFLQQAGNLQGVTIRTPPDDQLSHHIFCLEKEDMSATDLKNALYDDHDIDVRWMGSHGMNGVRISLAIYNTKNDIDILCDAIARVE